MARYGGGVEDFGDEAAKLAALRKQREALIAKEQAYQKEVGATESVEQKRQARQKVNRQARKEAAEVEAREERVRGRSARAADIDTEAIKRNTEARRRHAEETRRAQQAAGRGPGMEMVPHPDPRVRYGRQVYAPPTQGAGRPGIVAEGGPGVGGRVGSSEGYDRGYLANLQRQTAAKQAAMSASERYVASLTAEERAYHNDVVQRATRLQENRTVAENRARDATRRAGVEMGTASQQMRRHGALTSEFIAAAARGETTLREMGFQATATIGKFAGWTAAASAIYGALGAVHQLGRGAIDSASGVEQLRRVVNNVDRDQAQSDFRDLSGKFNVPIADSADAVYRMGQVFHDQADATKAAEAALYSFKTGEVDVATSTQNLIAITRGFGLSSEDLLSVYDQINQAQNTFGIRIADTEAGLAKAGGTFKNAGGDLDYLLGLFVAIQKSTGRSGQEIGTGIARGVNQIRQASNQEKLRAQGVDVDPTNFQSTVQSAMEAARRPGADIQQIATGLLGNQYARLLSPVLTDQTTLNQALKDTSPEASKASAQKELAKVLSQVDEEITKVGTNLQRLGSGLGQAGLGDIPFLMLKGLNAVLGTAVKLVDIFDQLPAPLRHGLSLMLQMAVVLKALRRFGGSEALANRVPALAFMGRPDERLKQLSVKGMRDQETEMKNYRESSNRTYLRARADSEGARLGLREFDTGPGRGLGRMEASEKQRKLAERRLFLESEVVATEQRANQAQAAANGAKTMQITAEQERAALEKVSAANVRSHLAARNIPVPYGFDQPDARGSRYIQEPVGGTSGLPMILPRGTEIGGTSGLPMQTNAREMKGLERKMRSQSAAMRVLGARSSELGYAGRAAGGVARTAANVTDRAASAISRTGPALKGLGGSVKNLIRGLGPLDAAIIGLIVFSELASKAKELEKHQNEAIDALGKRPSTRAGERAQIAKEQAALKPYTAGTALREGVAGITDVFRLRPFTDSEYMTPAAREELKRKEAKLSEGERERIKSLQQTARRSGGPIPLQFLDQINSQMEHDAKLREQGLITQAEFDRRMAQHAIEIQTAQNASLKDINASQAARRAAIRAGAPREDFKARFKGAGAQELETAVGATDARLQSITGRGDRFNLRERAAEYRYQMAQFAGSDDPKAIASMIEAREAYLKSLSDSAQAELDAGLLGARSEGARTAAFRRAAGRLREGPDAARSQLRVNRAQLARAKERADASKATLDAARAATGGNIGGVASALEYGSGVAGGSGRAGVLLGGAAAALRKLKTKAASDKSEVARLARQGEDFKENLEEAIAKSAEDKLKLIDAHYEDRTEGRNVRRDLALSRTRNPSEQAAITVSAAAAQVRDARRTYGTRDRHYLQALTALNNARQAQADSIARGVEASNALITARASGDPEASARAAVVTAQRTLSALRRAGADKDEITQAMAALITSRIALANFLRDQAAAMAGLQFDIASARAQGNPVAQARIGISKARDAMRRAKNPQEQLQATLDLVNANNAAEEAIRDREAARSELLASRTDDPVKKAKIERDAARRAIRGTTPGSADNLRARARYNESNRSLVQAKVTSAQDDIEFDLEMGKISRDVAVRQLQSLLKMHGISKQAKRDILRRIKGIKDESDAEASGFGLDMGSLKLPTIYDVRRAIKGAQGGMTQGTHAKAEITNYVKVEVNDPKAADAVYDAMDRAMGSSVQATLRTAGLRM